MAKLYGDERALQMVKTQPIVLTLNAKNFAPSLQVWSDKFGKQAAQDMVARNPGLLGIPPVLAAEDANATMVMSYVIAFTRPSLPKLIVATAVLIALTSGVTN